jgi:hypothetical protein
MIGRKRESHPETVRPIGLAARQKILVLQGGDDVKDLKLTAPPETLHINPLIAGNDMPKAEVPVAQ